MSFGTAIISGVIIAVTGSAIFTALNWLQRRALRRKYANAPRDLAGLLAEMGDESYWQARIASQAYPWAIVDNTPAIMSYISSSFWRCFDTNRRTLLEYMPDIGENIDIIATHITIAELQMVYLHNIMHAVGNNTTNM